MKVSWINFFLLCVFSNASLAQQQHSITLAESKKAALEYSKQIKNSQLGIQSAEAGKKSAAANYYPSVSATAIGLYNFKDFVGAIPPILEKGIDNFYFAGATATEVLYAGSKIRTANELASLEVEINKIRAKQSVDSVLLQTEQKYWNLVNLQEQVKTLTANEQYLNGILKMQEDLLAAGFIARNDLLKVKVQHSKLLLNKSKLNNGRKVALLDFCFFLGIPYDTTLVAADGLDTAHMPPIQDTAPTLDLTGNKDYQLLEKSLTAEQLQTRMAKADMLPTVSVGMSAGQAGVISNNLGSMFVPMAFGTINIPISSWWGSGKQKMNQRSLAEKIAANRFEHGEQQIKVGLLQAWYTLEDAQKEIAYAKENFNQAAENLRVTRDNYESGLANITDLLDAQTQKQEAESEQIKALGTFYMQQATYHYLTGKITQSDF